MTLKKFADKVYGGMCRIREGREGHGEDCECHICEGARVVLEAFNELRASGQWTDIPTIKGYQIIGRLGR